MSHQPVVGIIGNAVPRQLVVGGGAIPFRITGSWQGPIDPAAAELLGAVDAPAARIAPSGGPRRRAVTLEVVGMAEINKICAARDARGVHRELPVLPLGPGQGRVRKLPSGKLEIIVDRETPIDEWLQGLPALIRAAMA